MKTRILIALFTLLIFCVYVQAFAEVNITAEVDKLSITADETVTYKLAVTSTENRAFQPQVPDFSGFTVVSQAQSSTVSFIEGGFKSIGVYVYILAPKDSGSLQIKPAHLKIKDKVISAQGFSIEVKPGKSAPPPKAPPQSQEPQVTL